MRGSANVSGNGRQQGAAARWVSVDDLPRHANPALNGRKLIVQTQNASKPAALVMFEYLVMAATIGSLTYLLFKM